MSIGPQGQWPWPFLSFKLLINFYSKNHFFKGNFMRATRCKHPRILEMRKKPQNENGPIGHRPFWPLAIWPLAMARAIFQKPLETSNLVEKSMQQWKSDKIQAFLAKRAIGPHRANGHMANGPFRALIITEHWALYGRTIFFWSLVKKRAGYYFSIWWNKKLLYLDPGPEPCSTRTVPLGSLKNMQIFNKNSAKCIFL